MCEKKNDSKLLTRKQEENKQNKLREMIKSVANRVDNKNFNNKGLRWMIELKIHY